MSPVQANDDAVKFKLSGGSGDTAATGGGLTDEEAHAWLAQSVTPRAAARTITKQEVTS
jgi:hypothetical protein